VSAPGRTDLGAGEAVAIVGLCFGLPIWWSLQAVLSGYAGTGSGGGFNDGALLSMMVQELVTGALAIGLLRWRGYAVGSLHPDPDLSGAFIALVLCGTALMADQVLMAFIWNPHVEQPIQRLMQVSHPSVGAIVPASLVNGAFEEVFLLGALQRGLERHGASFALGASSLVRVSYHLYQGPIGAAGVLVWGLVLSLYYQRSRKLWPPVFAHGLWDILAFMH